MKKSLAWLIVVLYLAISAVACAQPQIPPAPTSSIYVQDYAGVLSAETKNRINSIGTQLAAKTKAQIVVVTIKSLEGATTDEYGLALVRQWGIGDKTLNNGVLMLVAVGERQSRIEVGYGLEGALPDAKTGQLQDDYMLPHFKQGDYNQGILNGYQALVSVVAKEYNIDVKTDAKPVPKQTQTTESFWDSLPWWIHLAIIAGVLLLFLCDWLFWGGTITFLLLSLLRSRGGGGGSGGDSYGGGSSGGGGSNRNW